LLIYYLKGLTLVLHFSLFILHFSMLIFQNVGHRGAIGGCAADAVFTLPFNRPRPSLSSATPSCGVNRSEFGKGMADK
jgi:hypothetical protein